MPKSELTISICSKSNWPTLKTIIEVAFFHHQWLAKALLFGAKTQPRLVVSMGIQEMEVELESLLQVAQEFRCFKGKRRISPFATAFCA
jgi:hypothetical protein